MATTEVTVNEAKPATAAPPGPMSLPKFLCNFVATACLRAFPPITWVPKYNPKQQLLRDFAGGVVMGVMLVPMGLGYASLLNIPLHIGLWSAVIYSGMYSLFGNTGVLSMGPVAEITLMLMSTSGLGTDPWARARALQTISFEVGFLSLALCFVMGGTIIRNSFARAVGNAYAAAAGIILILVQMKDALNITGTSTVLLHEAIQVIITGLRDAPNGYNVFYCFCIFVLLFSYLMGVKYIKWMPSWVPHQLIVVVVTILICWLGRLDNKINLHIVKSVQSDWPPASAPDTTIIGDTIVTGVVITLVSFLQMYSIATRFSDDVHANQELFANGLCAMLSGFLGTLPGSSSFSRSSVLTDINARTPLNSFFSALVVFISVVGLARADVFYYLPKVTLAAIICAAVLKLVKFNHAIWLWKHFKLDFFVWFVVFVLTLFLGVAYGILVGIGLSTLIVLFSVGVPKSSTLAYDANRDVWIDSRIDDELLVHREVHVWSFDSPLYFINVSYFTSQLESSMKHANRPIRVVVVNCSGITSIDASSVESFEIQAKNVESRKRVLMVFAALLPEVKEALLQCPAAGFPFKTFDTINAAVAYADGVVAAEKDLLVPHRPVPAALYTKARPGKVMKKPIGVVAIVSNADRSPKQKLKLLLKDSALATVLFTTGPHDVVPLEVDPTDHVFLLVRDMLLDWPRNDPHRRRVAHVLSAVMETHTDDLSIVVKRNFRGDDILIAKWGGVVTPVGVTQAEACGRAVAARLGLAEDQQVDEGHSDEAFHKILHQPKTRKVTKVLITATTNGEARVTHTGIAFSRAFAETSGIAPSSHFIVEEALSAVCDESHRFSDANLAMVQRALHANTGRLRQRFLHVPGMRRVLEIMELAANDELHVPRNALIKVAQMTRELIAAVKRGPPTPPPPRPVADVAPALVAAPNTTAPESAASEPATAAFLDPLPFPPTPMSNESQVTTTVADRRVSVGTAGSPPNGTVAVSFEPTPREGLLEDEEEHYPDEVVLVTPPDVDRVVTPVSRPRELPTFVEQPHVLRPHVPFEPSTPSLASPKEGNDGAAVADEASQTVGAVLPPQGAALASPSESGADVFEDDPLPFPPTPASRGSTPTPCAEGEEGESGSAAAAAADMSPNNEPFATCSLDDETDAFVVESTPAQHPLLGNVYFADGESAVDFIRRYSIILDQFCNTFDYGATSDDDGDDGGSVEDGNEDRSEHHHHHYHSLQEVTFNVSKLTALYSNATYDLIHNAKKLDKHCGFDLRPLVALLQPLNVAVTNGRFGLTASDRLIGGALQGLALLRRLQEKLTRFVEQQQSAFEPESPSNDAIANGGELPSSVLPIDMIFTPSAVITALRLCMALSHVMRTSGNHSAEAALLQEESGAQTMAHIIFALNKEEGEVVDATPTNKTPASGPALSPADTHASFFVPPPDDDPFVGYTLDVYASTGASLRAEAAKGLLLHRIDTTVPNPTPSPPVVKGTEDDDGVASPTAAEKDAARLGHFANRLGELDELPTPSGSDDDDDDATLREHHMRTRQAARLLTKVAPMTRVWRLPLRDFVNIVDEMQHVVDLWKEEDGDPTAHAIPTFPLADHEAVPQP